MPRKKARSRMGIRFLNSLPGMAYAISFWCRIGDQPAVHPANPAIHNVKHRSRTRSPAPILFLPSKSGLSSFQQPTYAKASVGPCDLAWPATRSCEAARGGGASRDRTGDLKLAKLALSQLSYGPGLVVIGWPATRSCEAAKGGGPGTS